MTQSVLRTPRLQLVPLADEHLALEIELDSDAEVLRHLWGRARTRDEVLADHAIRLERASQIDGLGWWAGFESSAPGDFIGLWILQPPHGPSQSEIPGEADLGFRLMRNHWRKGLGSEGASELIRYGFENMDCSRIFAQTAAGNVASRATLAAVGMHFVREFREQGTASGSLEVEYELLRTARS